MPTVQPFNRDMLKAYLQENELHFLTDADGDFEVRFSEDAFDADHVLYLGAEGAQDDVLCIRMRYAKRYPHGDWDRCLKACNRWNQQRRWPKAYLLRSDSASDQGGRIVLEQNLDLEEGIHQELLNDLIDTTLRSAFSFWTWAQKERGL